MCNYKLEDQGVPFWLTEKQEIKEGLNENLIKDLFITETLKHPVRGISISVHETLN